MATLTRSPIRIQAALVNPHARRYAKYAKHNKPIPITRDEKKQYFENNDYCYEHVEKYYTVIREQLEKNNTIEDPNIKLAAIYEECFPIISLISEGKREPFS
jgi:hypothetical protein